MSTDAKTTPTEAAAAPSADVAKSGATDVAATLATIAAAAGTAPVGEAVATPDKPGTSARSVAAPVAAAHGDDQDGVASAPLAPPCVYLIADHLDAVLAAGEDITALLRKPAEAGPSARRRWIEKLRTFELVIVARCLQAADRARDLAAVDDRFRALATLFVSGTAVLADRIAEYGDSTGADFESGDDGAVYLTRCGLTDPGRSWEPESKRGFLIAGLVTLEPLLDMCGSFLDALEVHYALFDDEDEVAAAA
jgi:hypothetical protein